MSLGWQVGGDTCSDIRKLSGQQGGSMIAPLIGGFLARPADTFPSVFRHTIFQQYPYALPILVSASVPLCAAIGGIFFAKETLPQEKRKAMRHLFQRTKHTINKSKPQVGMFSRASVFILLVYIQMIVSAAHTAITPS